MFTYSALRALADSDVYYGTIVESMANDILSLKVELSWAGEASRDSIEYAIECAEIDLKAQLDNLRFN